MNNWEKTAKALELKLKIKQNEIEHLEFVLEKVSKRLMFCNYEKQWFEKRDKEYE